jgi:soluble lytic murein transglycosylase-like protein
VASRTRELDQQVGNLEGELQARRQSFERSEARYKEQARAAYKGDNLDGFVGVLGGVLGSGGGEATLSSAQIRKALFQGWQSLDEFRDSRQELKNSIRQVTQKRADYGEASRKEKEQVARLRQREERLERAVSRVSAGKARTDARIQRLRESERTRIQKTRPATVDGDSRSFGGGVVVQRTRELKIARDKIVARPVKPIPKKQYKKLYQKSAKKYGFGRDWYILAAVGKVESDHGENMGPSSAGAMGPMQFLPSTWETSGVDGNGDGVANVMDPRDAIPAAARYLKTGGAPKDWYAALYSYNHADWYVKKVLGVAEGYRRLAKDGKVGPYV